MKPYRVLIVDDSVVYRSQIRLAIESSPEFEVSGVAANGNICLSRLSQIEVDVVVLDMEMPELDGISTLRKMRSLGFKQPVIVFSAHTVRGADSTMEALSLGATDFIAKPNNTAGNTPHELIARQLLPILKGLRDKKMNEAIQAPKLEIPPADTKKNLKRFSTNVVVIGSSTGGPQALEMVLTNWVGPISVPVLIVQHMPPLFTTSLAARLARLSGHPVKEAEHGDVLSPGHFYIAPGDSHMRIARDNDDSSVKIVLHQGPKRNYVRPACNELFESAAEVYGASCLCVVLTGMGEDGKVGGIEIRRQGGAVLIQDQASSTVFGMPGALFEAGAYDKIGNLKEIAETLTTITSGKIKNAG